MHSSSDISTVIFSADNVSLMQNISVMQNISDISVMQSISDISVMQNISDISNKHKKCPWGKCRLPSPTHSFVALFKQNEAMFF